MAAAIARQQIRSRLEVDEPMVYALEPVTSFGDAIDIYGFRFDDGDTWTLIDDWEHDTSNPSTAAGRFLYDAAYRWHDDRVWTIILTPNYNAAHDNHFHVDRTPNADYIGATDGYYIGPNLGH